MTYRLKITDTAEKQWRRIARSAQERVRSRILALADEPRPRGCVKLRGDPKTYRIRIGDYRVIYDVDDEDRTVTILKVKHRRDVYRP